jgi:hypothetical protein
MAELRAFGANTSWMLTREELVGRSSTCDWQLTEEDVSAQHAALRWTGKVWELQDLGSRNGTFVRGQRLGPGLRLTLTPGARIRFGTRGPEWLLVDVSPPRTLAIRMRDRTRVVEDDGTLVLPSATDPKIVVFRDTDGTWVLEDDDGGRPVADDQTLIVDNEPWRLRTEAPVVETYQSSSAAISDLQLHFRVSSDEEHVEVKAELAGHSTLVPSRVHHYLLLTLARQRLSEMQQNPQATASHGWVHPEQLSKMLRKSAMHINVEIYRARQQFAELGFAGAVKIIERRRDTGEIRLGCADLTVESL